MIVKLYDSQIVHHNRYSFISIYLYFIIIHLIIFLCISISISISLSFISIDLPYCELNETKSKYVWKKFHKFTNDGLSVVITRTMRTKEP